MNVELRPDFTWRFLILEVGPPIIGVDHFPHYGLFLDCRDNVLLDGVTSPSTPGFVAPLSIPSVKVIDGGKDQTATWKNSRG
jgi:hypothetical protein